MNMEHSTQRPPRFRLLTRTRFLQRFYGLLGRNRPPGRRLGLLFSPCRAVHTWGMRYPIDIVFLGRDGRVLNVVQHLAPWRMALCLRAVAVVELRAGTIAAKNGEVAWIETAAKNAIGR